MYLNVLVSYDGFSVCRSALGEAEGPGGSVTGFLQTPLCYLLSVASRGSIKVQGMPVDYCVMESVEDYM